MIEGSDTERFSTWIANWQVTARKNETGLSPVVWNINYLFGNFYVGQVTHLTIPRSVPDFTGQLLNAFFHVNVCQRLIEYEEISNLARLVSYNIIRH